MTRWRRGLGFPPCSRFSISLLRRSDKIEPADAPWLAGAACVRWRTQGAVWAALLCIAWLFVASPAHAEAGVALSWRSEGASRACGSESAIREAVERRLGRRPFTDPDHAKIWITGEEVAVGRDQFRARVTQRDRDGVASGSRELEPQPCASLVRGAVLIISLFIDRAEQHEPDEAAKSEPVSPMEPATRTEPETRAPVIPPPPAVVSPRTSTRIREAHPPELWLGAGAGTSIGVLPSLDGAFFVAARLNPSRSRWSFEWRGTYHLPQRIDDHPVAGVVSAVDQRLSVCLSPFSIPIAKLDFCGGLTWTAVIPQTKGTSQGNERARAVIGPMLGVALQLGQRPLVGRLELGVALPHRQYTFVYTDPYGVKKSFYSTGEVLFFVSIAGLRTIL